LRGSPPVLLLACLLLPLTGCITSAGHNLDPLEPVAGSLVPAIKDTVGDFRFEMDGGAMVTSERMGRDINEAILDRWHEAGWISSHEYVEASDFGEDARHRMTLAGSMHGESSIAMQILSGLSLLMIPHDVKAKFDLRYSLLDVETGCTFEARVGDSYRQSTQLLLLVVAPISNRGVNETLDRLAEHVYARLHQQGAFDPHPSCVPASISDAVAEQETTERAEPMEPVSTGETIGAPDEEPGDGVD
jgi:hypothetical protein